MLACGSEKQSRSRLATHNSAALRISANLLELWFLTRQHRWKRVTLNSILRMNLLMFCDPCLCGTVMPEHVCLLHKKPECAGVCSKENGVVECSSFLTSGFHSALFLAVTYAWFSLTCPVITWEGWRRRSLSSSDHCCWGPSILLDTLSIRLPGLLHRPVLSVL